MNFGFPDPSILWYPAGLILAFGIYRGYRYWKNNTPPGMWK